MGLELVEIVMTLEDEFGITIPDEDAQKLTTCREVTDYIITRAPSIKLQAQSCITQAQFYRLRQRLMSDFDIPRKAIRTKTRMRDILKGDFKSQWNKLKRLPEFSDFPSLICPVEITLPGLLIFFIISIALLFYSLSYLIAFAGTVALMFCFIAFILPIFQTKIPPAYETVGGLAMVTNLYASPPKQTHCDIHPPTQEIDDYVYRHTLYRVTCIVASVLYWERPKDIRPDAHFIKDLGAS